MSPLTNDERLFLLRLARRALEVRLENKPAVNLSLEAPKFSPALRQRAGIFVSLHKSDELRGCVGFVEPRLPLYRAVMETALAAATEDPRFSPLAAAELSEIAVEISVLSQPLPITAREIRIGVHGLMITQGPVRGLILPQVAVERQWSPERFLEETCRKAGLACDAWRRGARVEAFQAVVFGEKSLVAGWVSQSLL
ncbi:MAG: AmmeMemoRadiSam system protein A [Acidobacteria bacterium]|nr:AmmeMemoRadiSam system protein A [Acidobacteriota bacterium]